MGIFTFPKLKKVKLFRIFNFPKSNRPFSISIVFFFLIISSINCTAQCYSELYGIFSYPENFDHNLLGKSVEVDCDLDSDVDIFVVTKNRRCYHDLYVINLFQNLGDLSFERKELYVSAEVLIIAGSVDLDGDGDADLVVVRGTNELVTFLNDGDNNYTESDAFSSGVFNLYGNVGLLDIDNDGLLDVYRASEESDDIIYFRNVGGGIFDVPQILCEIFNPYDLILSDLNNDGLLDLVIIRTESGGINWIENIGGGDYSPDVHLIGSIYEAKYLYSHDFDEDGDEDLLVGSSFGGGGGVFRILKNDLTYDTWASGPYVAVPEASFMIVEDFDDDGDLDFWSGSASAGTIVKIENIGLGVLSGATIICYTEDDSAPHLLDIDNDGDRDVVLVRDTYYEDYILFRENIDGDFMLGDFKSLSYLAFQPKLTILADLDGNGFLDPLSISHSDKMIGYFQMAVDEFSYREIDRTIPSVSQLVVGTIKGDDLPEIIVGTTGGEIYYFDNLGAAEFADPELIVSDLGVVKWLQLCDLDGDSLLDIVVESTLLKEVFWMKNLGDGVFSEKIIIYDDYTSSASFNCADFNNDGNTDILIVDATTTELFWKKNLGAGAFGEKIVIDLVSLSIKDLICADLNNDSFLDVLILSSFSKVYWYPNMGGESFGDLFYIINEGVAISDIAVADFDLDNDLDIIVTRGSIPLNVAYWHENINDGETFLPNYVVYGSHSRNKVETGDIDNDGDIDLVFATNSVSGAGRRVSYLKNMTLFSKHAKGHLYFDANENGVRDSSEVGLEFLQVLSSSETSFSHTDEEGRYIINFIPSETGLISVFPESLEYWGITSIPTSYSLLFDELVVTYDSIDFGFFPDTLVNRTTSNLISDTPKCNTTINYWLNYKNTGTTIVNGIVEFELDEALTFEGAEIMPDSIVGSSCFWSFDSLFYFDYSAINIQIGVPDIMLDDETLTSVQRTYILNELDEIVSISTDTLEQTISCLNNSNTKTVTPKGTDSLGYVHPETNTFTYTIHFQNTGTDTSVAVIITDQLDDNFDLTSFEILAFSHSLEYTIGMEGQVIFTFEDIMLPDSSSNEIQSHGYVTYTVQLIDDYIIGTTIENKATINVVGTTLVVTNIVLNTPYNCGTVLNDVGVPSEVCYGDSLLAWHPYPPENTIISWHYLDSDTVIGNDFIYQSEAIGINELYVNMSADFCELDTVIFVQTLPVYSVFVDSVSICELDSIIIFGNYQKEIGYYFDTLTSISGCDSVLNIYLKIDPVPVIESLFAEDTIICIQDAPRILFHPEGGIYEGEGMIGGVFYPDVAGSGSHMIYYSFADELGCTSLDSIQLYLEDCLGLEERNSLVMNVYPNPFSLSTTINFSQEQFGDNELIIYNSLGQKVYVLENVFGNEIVLNGLDFEAGLYLLSFTDLKDRITISLVVK